MKMEIPNSNDRAARIQREREDAQAAAAVRQSTTRNIPAAISMFALAMLLAWKGYDDGYTIEIGGKDVFVVKGLISLVGAFLAACAGIGRLWVSPGDKLLGRIVDDYLRKNADDARKSSMATHAAQHAVTAEPPAKPADKVATIVDPAFP